MFRRLALSDLSVDADKLVADKDWVPMTKRNLIVSCRIIILTFANCRDAGAR